MPTPEQALEILASAPRWLWTRRWRITGVLACGAAPGYAWWMLGHRDALGRLAENRLAKGEAGEIVTAAVVSLVLAVLAIAVVHLRRRDRDRELEASVDLCLRHGVLALTLPMIAVLATPGLETTSPWFTLALAAAAAAIVGSWTSRLPGLGEPANRNKLVLVWLPATLATLAAGGYAYALSHLALLQHYNLVTSTYDLGIYDSVVWNASQGYGLRSTLVRGDTHITAHFDPILILLSPIYMVRPGAETLLTLQSVWIAAGSLPLYLLGRRKLDSHWAGLALVLCYVLHPGIHGANAYHFHSLSLAIPLLLAAVLLLETGPRWAYAVVVVVLLLVREDVSLLTMSLGLYALITDRRRVGLLTMAASLAYLLVVKLLVMPDPGLLMESSHHSYGYSNYFEYLIPGQKGGVRALLTSLISNPVFVLRSVVTEEKLLYVARCFGPLWLLPLFARPGRVLLAYGLVFCLLGTKPALYSLHFQYVTLHTPFAFALVPLVLANPQQSPALRRLVDGCPQFVRAALTGCVVMSALVSWNYGALVENNSFQAGYFPLARSHDEQAGTRHEWVIRAREMIPPDASVGATDRLVPHLSGRLVIEKYPDDESRGLDYLMIDVSDRRVETLELRKLERSGAYRRIDTLPPGLILLQRNPAVPLPPKPEKPKTPSGKPNTPAAPK